MKSFSKILKTGSIALIAVATAGAGVASASVDFANSNNITGARSENIGRLSSDRNWFIDWQNNGRVFNTFDKFVNTGNNSLDRNTTAFGESTGSISLDTILIAPDSLNVVDFGLGQTAANSDVSAIAQNFITGANSNNENLVNADQNFTLRSQNNALVRNRAEVNVNTGNNQANRNTSIGNISTGDVDASVTLDNTALINPLTSLDLSGLGENNVSASFGNGTTGFNSTNVNHLDSNSNVTVTLENNSEITNDVFTDANTGRNDVNENTTVGNVSTGDVTIRTSVTQ